MEIELLYMWYCYDNSSTVIKKGKKLLYKEYQKTYTSDR